MAEGDEVAGRGSQGLSPSPADGGLAGAGRGPAGTAVIARRGRLRRRGLLRWWRLLLSRLLLRLRRLGGGRGPTATAAGARGRARRRRCDRGGGAGLRHRGVLLRVALRQDVERLH